MKENMLFLLVGGLGFFFFGMRTMSDALKKVAGERLKAILHMVTRVPLVGVLVGAAVTCLIQSSSATTVMVVGFVNAGLLVLKQAISVIIGANIGTTFTAWLVSSMSIFKVTHYALPAVGIGFAMMTFAKTKKGKAWGEVLLGFGILFIGLDFMKDAFGPLKDSQAAKNVFVMFSENPLLGVLVGTFFTMVLQSSSATIAIVQVLAFNGLITFPAAIPLILGDNIGTTITAQMAAVGSNINARRAAMSHTVFNVIGVSYMLVFVYTGFYVRLVDAIIPGAITLKNIMFHIAVAHSLFNVVNALVFLPFIGWLANVSTWLVPQRKGTIDMGPQYLEKHLLDTPPLAMQVVRNEINYMLGVATKGVILSLQSFIEDDPKKIRKVRHYESVTDNLQSEITQYVVELSQKELSERDSKEMPVLIHNVNDIERIGDHAQNIAELAEAKIDNAIKFSDQAQEELAVIQKEILSMMNETLDALKDNDVERAGAVLKREGKINQLQTDFKETHLSRMNRRECSLRANFIFLDFIDNVEKIADHLTNVAQGVIGQMQWVNQLKDIDDPDLMSSTADLA